MSGHPQAPSSTAASPAPKASTASTGEGGGPPAPSVASDFETINPSFEAIQAAHRRIAPHIHRTPVMSSTSLDQLAGAELYFKCENLQRSGSFKMRGASNAVFSLRDEEAARGVVTHSSGNHAAGVVKAYGDLGMRAAGIRLIGPMDVVPDTKLQDMGDAAIGTIVMGHYAADLDNAANKDFVKAFHEAYGLNAYPDFMTAAALFGANRWCGLLHRTSNSI